MSTTQDGVNVFFNMFMVNGVMWEYPEPDREYHPPILRPFHAGISGLEFVWAKTIGADREYCQPLSRSCPSTTPGMFLLSGIIREHSEADREYHPPFSSPITSGISGSEFAWGIQMWEIHGADRVLPNMLWFDDYSDKLFGVFTVEEDKRIYQNES